MINKTVWMPFLEARQLGIDEIGMPDPITGKFKRQLMYSSQAQEFLPAHLEGIASQKNTGDHSR